ncbi:hypothetical protein QIS99_28295 [Streptomyces sp. B-S-A8]|uniref:Uncharacterized protein n=1 Tax=Streptomyces solicavernae TaxID=3043614 RepID=A0ABT6S048_9ACTN|nr:hypothetical protein [Streptomyces sp. B-S-A8]MDI3390063.1 hypothetical protein [Streptomyces sp. B-S-A8]
MNTTHHVLAGDLKEIGDHFLNLGGDWADGSLKVVLGIIVVVKVVQKFSMKAGIGALIGLVLALGIYDARDDLGDSVTDEITNIGAPSQIPTYSSPATTPEPAKGGEPA